MLEKLRKTSFLLSSNWYKRYKIPYLILIADVFFIILFAFFAAKDYLVGHFDSNYPYDGILILIIVSVLLIVRFNISLLMFARQRFGLYLSILFLLTAISIEVVFSELPSPFILIFSSFVLFINDFFIKLPDIVNTILIYFFYLFSIYGPVLYYVFLHYKKLNLSNSARTFDVMTGFYASTLSKKLKIIDMVVYGFVLGIAMIIGLVSKDINWVFLSIPLTLYIMWEFFNKMHFPHLTKKKKKIIYLTTLLITFGVMYTQKIPYIGLAFFSFSVLFIFILLSSMSKSPLRSLVITLYAFVLIPIFIMGYNLFAYPEYGVIKKSIPFENEKIVYYIVDKDGNLGFRNRRLKIIRPAYTKIIYSKKNCIKLLNKKSEWETYIIPETNNKILIQQFDLFIPAPKPQPLK